MVEIYIDPKVRALRELHGELLARDYSDSSILDRLSCQVTSILDGHRAGNHAVTFHLGSWCPEFIGADPSVIMASSVSRQQAEETIAKEHGYRDWRDVETLAGTLLDEAFENAVDAVVSGELSRLQAQIRERPALARQRSQYGHRATLLHYLGANGVESYRQMTPLNAPDVARCLVDAGADVNAHADMYGGKTTALELVLTSAHPHNAGVVSEIAAVLESVPDGPARS